MNTKILLYNTLTKKKETFKARNSDCVRIYACGPTVYGYTHVGNARAALVPDLVKRIFEWNGYKVKYVRNITDVEDKIIKAAVKEGCTAQEIALKYEKAFLEEMKSIGLHDPEVLPRATEHIPEMISMIEQLIEKDFAYPAETPFGKDVYFRVDKFKDYGKLSKKNIEDLEAGARIEPGEMKENPLDFVLWKAAKEGEPHWSSPWGEGRPGWHIECSAMVQKHCPEGLDIHMGGLDLSFPHHENEIAQSEACFDKCFSTYWVHNGMLTVEREKMSKSLGNIFTTKEFLKDFGPEVFKLFLLQHHYRSPVDFNEESILQTEALLERIYKGKEKALEAKKQCTQKNQNTPEKFATFKEEVENALRDDFNSAKALGVILKFMRLCFREDKKEYWTEWGTTALPILQQVLALVPSEPKEAFEELKKRRFQRMGVDQNFCDQIKERLVQREEFRKNKDFEKADQLRKDLEAEGILIMDGPDGSAWALTKKRSLNA